MMSKAAFMMQDHLRKNCNLLTDVHNPNVFIVRGFLPFPQGLAALAVLFRGKLAADVYSHPYFIEKQSDPSQPSPQLHLTEECQSVMKIIKGLHFMKDDSSKLDNTMVFATDYSVETRGRMLTFASEEEDAAVMAGRQGRKAAAVTSWRNHNGINNRSSFSPPTHSPLSPHTHQSHIASGGQFESEKTGRLVERDGAHTVLYNPIATDPKTFGTTIQKLHDEERVVKTIVVPTRQAWGGVRSWAEAFPDADILCSGNALDRGAMHQLRHETTRHSGGCVDMGNGMTGLSFPEVDASELPGAEDTSDCMPDSTLAGDGDNICRLCLLPAFASSWQDVDDEVRRSSRICPLGEVPHWQITPNIELLRVAGDDHTNEYVLYDRNSEVLACTDLFHGEYGDLDPVNTWMCRVWFKFMKAGNYKRVDLVPQLKWLQVKRHGSLEALRGTVDMLTRTRNIKYLLHAHGTPPRMESPADSLRVQWGMSLLEPTQQQQQQQHDEQIAKDMHGRTHS